MIGYLKGICRAKSETELLVDVSGVGYEVSVTNSHLETVSEGGICALWIYTHVREDQIQLFGFNSELERRIFKTLLKVNGVGPKMAMNIMSGASVENLINLIESENVSGLTKIPKVGKKIAEQIILALRGKLTLAPEGEGKKTKLNIAGNRKDIYSALINLGYKGNEVDEVIGFIPSEIEISEGVRKGLKLLSGV